MIYYQHIKTQSGEIWILDAMENSFFKPEEESRQEFEAHVLREIVQFTIGNVNLEHEPNGAPFIQNRTDLYLSISHSENWFVLYVSNNQSVGVDIEINSNQINKTEHYFLTDVEIDQIQPNHAELQICWGIKESIYKLFHGEIQSIKHDIKIISIEKNIALAKVKNQKIQLGYMQSANFTFVYTN